jgi:hypothetical protein
VCKLLISRLDRILANDNSTALRATERVSREFTTALGKQAARAIVGVLG